MLFGLRSWQQRTVGSKSFNMNVTSSMFFLKPLQFQFIIFGLSTLVYFEMDLHQDPSLVLRVIDKVHYMNYSQQAAFESPFADDQFKFFV